MNPDHKHESGKPEAPEPSGSVPPAESFAAKLAAHEPEIIREFMALSLGQVSHPLFEKLNEEHISKAIEIAAQDSRHKHELACGRQKIESSNRFFKFAVFVASLGFVAALIAIFRGQPDVLVPLITGLLAFVGGFGSGWGFGRHGANE